MKKCIANAMLGFIHPLAARMMKLGKLHFCIASLLRESVCVLLGLVFGREGWIKLGLLFGQLLVVLTRSAFMKLDPALTARHGAIEQQTPNQESSLVTKLDALNC